MRLTESRNEVLFWRLQRALPPVARAKPALLAFLRAKKALCSAPPVGGGNFAGRAGVGSSLNNRSLCALKLSICKCFAKEFLVLGALLPMRARRSPRFCATGSFACRRRRD